MYFKRLEMFGFKSFANKTVLNFEPGITAVVGPNGCGKSNVFDAIRWVLGEQSVKELRGSDMEDVIFNGTDNKLALGFAEVQLTFSNESKILSIDYDEVTIARRLFRSGESEYLINKNVVRLKDIKELFMGTGIGAEAYSLIQQGKVDLIVSAKPEDRRYFLDEAAGITKYKSKRKEALNKLSDTENNLLRINDIIIEVKRQIASIERQAKKAQRYKDDFERLKILERRLGSFQIESLQQQMEVIRSQVEFFSSRTEILKETMAQDHQWITQEEEKLNALDQNFNEVQSQEFKLESQLDICHRQIGFGEEKLQNINHQEGRLSQKKTQLIERCRLQQLKIEELKQAVNLIHESIVRQNQTVHEKKDWLQVISMAMEEAKKTVIREEENIVELTSQQVNFKNDLTDIMKENQGCLARKRRLELELTKISIEKEGVEHKYQNVSLLIEQAINKINRLKIHQSDQDQILTSLKFDFGHLQESLIDLDKKKLLLNSQKEFVEDLRIRFQDMPDPVQETHILSTVFPSQEQGGVIGKVKKVSPLDHRQRDSVRGQFAFQGEHPIYDILCEAKFIELDPQQFVVKITEVNQEIFTLTQHKETLRIKIDEQSQLIVNVVKDIHDQEKILSGLEIQKNEILLECHKLKEEVDLVNIEISEANETLTSIQMKEDEIMRQVHRVEQELDKCQMTIQEKQEFIADHRQQREDTMISIAQLETAVESEKKQQLSQQESLANFSKELDRLLEEVQNIDNEMAEQIYKKGQLDQEVKELRVKIEELKDQRQVLKETFLNLELEKREMTSRLKDLHVHGKVLTQELEEIQRQHHAFEMKIQEKTFEEKAIRDRLLQTYKINLIELLPEPQGQPPEQELAISSIPEVITQEFINELEALKKKCDSYGVVNLIAIEEYEELRQRFEFLTKQQSDLITAKESLHQTINNINRTTRQLFMETFTRVDEEFRTYFRLLFGGGDARLILLDPENVLESGIDIIARPPGKKLQNISLLSGGEKTLTAIALIFGVFKVRPSPFCILDEIDAALDDLNVSRFGILLKEFSKIAQFVVITHNKKTMTQADIMYGITMQEKGISNIVSVRFSKEKDGNIEATEEVPVSV